MEAFFGFSSKFSMSGEYVRRVLLLLERSESNIFLGYYQSTVAENVLIKSLRIYREF